MKTALVRVRLTDSKQADLVCHVENNEVIKIFHNKKELRINKYTKTVLYRNEWYSYHLHVQDDSKPPFIDLPTIK